MKNIQDSKIKVPTEKQISDLFVEIEKFKTNNARYLLWASLNNPEIASVSKIITTNNTNT